MITYLKIFLIILYSIVCSVFALFSALFDRTFYTYFLISKIFSKGVLLISGVKLVITGLENINPHGTYVFVSNHSSQFDIPAVQLAAPVRISIIYKKEINRIPLFGWQMMLGPYIVIDRKNAEKAIASIQKAKALMDIKKIFSPYLRQRYSCRKQGRYSPSSAAHFYLAAKVGYPVIPVTINGASSILPKGN